MYNLFLEFDNDGNVENVYSIEVFLSRFLSLLVIKIKSTKSATCFQLSGFKSNDFKPSD